MERVTPRLSIAVVLFNSADGLRECLQSVAGALDGGWAELIVVDNASPDDSLAIAVRELPSATVLRLERNRGFAAGVNAAFAHASGDYWMMLNPDTQLPPQGLRTLVAWMDRHPGIGAASPEIVRRDGGWESPGRALPSISRTLLELLRLHRLLPARLRGRIMRGPYWTGGEQLSTGWVPGTAMLVRSAAARAAGPLREDLFMYGEDVEWCWRIRHAGWAIGVCAAVTLVHGSGASAVRTFGEDEQQRRIAAGIDAATRAMYGRAHARVLAASTAVSLLAEAWAPSRDRLHRARIRAAARTWLALARD